ncbi:DUF1389 domain-containing protein [Chlamydia vaughanii]|uniref:DUF1389 domain-containing protein n=1 Tax=Chlamydia vaughanii TaxID=3112552 RepID=UPI0032B1660B
MSAVLPAVPHTKVHHEGVRQCLVRNLRQYSLVLQMIASIGFSIVFASVIACGFAYPVIIAGLVLSLVVVAVILLRMVRSSLSPLLPQGFLGVIKEEYPEDIFEICTRKQLTIKELRVVVDGLTSGEFRFPTEQCRKKVEAFGLQRLQKACENVELPSLDAVLLKHCPFYFLKTFIELGPKEFPEAAGLPPEVYWTAPLGLSDCLNNIFDPLVFTLARVATEEEYNQLLYHAQNNTWDQADDIVLSLRRRVRSNRFYRGLNKFLLRVGTQMRASIRRPWLLYLCKHGVTWKQLQLFKCISGPSVGFLNEAEYCMEKLNLSRTMVSIYPYVHEDNENYEPEIALVTWEEWILWYETLCTPMHQSTLDLFCKRIKDRNQGRVKRNTLVLNPVPPYGRGSLILPKYDIDEKGNKRVSTYSGKSS